MTALVAIETVVLVIVCVLLVGLLRSHAVVLRRLHELGAGVGDPSASSAGVQPFRTVDGVPGPPDRTGLPAAHDVSGESLDGEITALRVVGAEQDTLLAFLSSTCLTCQRFWTSMSDPTGVPLPADTRLVIVVKDPAEESPSAVAELAPPNIPLVQSSKAWADYGVPGSPYFVMVAGATGLVQGEGTGLDWDQVMNLLGQADADASVAAGRKLPKAQSDAEREARVDRELRAAGIHPGDPSLYPGEPLTD